LPLALATTFYFSASCAWSRPAISTSQYRTGRPFQRPKQVNAQSNTGSFILCLSAVARPPISELICSTCTAATEERSASSSNFLLPRSGAGVQYRTPSSASQQQDFSLRTS